MSINHDGAVSKAIRALALALGGRLAKTSEISQSARRDYLNWSGFPLSCGLMNRAFKLAVLWLLLLAYPFQGAAAAAMVICGPTHHQRALALEQAVAEAKHGSNEGQHAHVAGAGQAHHHKIVAAHGHVDGQSEGEATASELSDIPQSPSHGGIKCSVCAACCVGASAPAQNPMSVWAPPSTHVRPIFDRDSVVGFFTDGPERPPRSHLA